MPSPPPQNPITQQIFQTFSRLPWPAHTDMGGQQGVISDLYNKIAAVQSGSQTVQSQIPSASAIQTQITQAIASATSATSPSSVIPKALNALIPINTSKPTAGDQYSINNAVVVWNIASSSDVVIYQYSSSNAAWSFVTGIVARTQTNLATLAGVLSAQDTGLLVDVTDFAHVLKWTGTAWTYNDPSDPAGRIESFLVDPSPTTGWHLCDGTANVPYLKADGTTGTQTLPDLTSVAANAAYLKMGSPASATPNAAVAPDSPLAYNGTTSAYILNNGNGSTGQTAQAKFTVAADSTGSLTAIKNGSNGEPRNLVLRPWFRT